MDKYLAKPTKIITENGFSYNINNYIEHNLPCGGSSGSNNNQSINNLIAEIDARVETLEEQIKKADNGACLEQRLSIKPFILCSDETLSHWELDKTHTMTHTVSMWIDVIAGAAYTAYLEQAVINNKITQLESTNGKCLETTITALPYEEVSDEALAFYSDYALRKDLPMTRSTTDWIKTLARLTYAPYMELPIINNKFATIQEQISQLQSSAASTTGGEDLLVIDQQLSTLNNRVTLMENNVSNNTTKIGVHTTDIAAMQNRIVDLETTVNTQSQLINELISRIEALEKA